MAHPMNEHRDHKVQKSRVSSISKGCYASGGSVHPDEAEDEKLLKKKVKKSALKMDGKESKHRSDRPNRAFGGRLKKPKHSKGHTVNVIVAPGGGQKEPVPVPVPHPVAMGAPAMPPPQRPPMPAGPPPGVAGPGLPPPGGMPGMGLRKAGGRAYKKGGAVVSDASRGATPVQHTDGKNDGKNIGRGPVITRKTGGPIYSPEKGGMGPKLDGGAGGGKARKEKPDRIII